MRLEQLFWSCEWNKELVATAREEVITLNVGHLGDAQGLIISLNASGFPMFSPYTHCWPMTHQPLYLHSKPLLHYLNPEASFCKAGGWGGGGQLHHLSFHPLLLNDVHMTWTISIFQNTAHAMHFSIMMYIKKWFPFIYIHQTGCGVRRQQRHSPELLRDWRHSI